MLKALNVKKGHKKLFKSQNPYHIMTSFSSVIQKEENMYIARCPETGTVSQGKSIEEALRNLKEATELYLSEFPSVHKGKPIMTVFEVVAHAKI